MKLITAIIKPYKLDDVLESLEKIGVQGLTATEVKGYGQQKGQADSERDIGRGVSFLPKVKIEIAAKEDQVDDIKKAIQTGARSGKIGDGKIFVVDLDEIIRIRTGETGAEAI